MFPSSEIIFEGRSNHQDFPYLIPWIQEGGSFLGTGNLLKLYKMNLVDMIITGQKYFKEDKGTFNN